MLALSLEAKLRLALCLSDDILLLDAAIEQPKCWRIQYMHCTAELDPEDQCKQRSPQARSLRKIIKGIQRRFLECKINFTFYMLKCTSSCVVATMKQCL